MKIFILLLTSFYCFLTFSSSVCDRTPAVKKSILEQMRKQDCSEITNEDLKDIVVLDLSVQKIGELRVGDFSGLTFFETI